MKPQYYLYTLCLCLLFSCADEDTFAPVIEDAEVSETKDAQLPLKSVYPDGFEMEDHARGSMSLDRINTHLARAGSPIRLLKMEALNAPGSDKAGSTVFFNDRGNRRLSTDWLPFDPLRNTGDDILYAIDKFDLPDDLSTSEYYDAIRSSMQTWEDVQCSDLDLPEVNLGTGDLGLVQFLLGSGGSPFFLPGITHAGFLPGAFFDIIGGPGGASSILGVTFTLTWTATGDVALKEIYYNDAFNWSTNGANIDFETVALHEVGHGLSQAHFGKLHRTDANGKFHFSPRAVMNAGYTGVQRSIRQTDNAGHCALWGNWPQN